ncbi:hypothetical protein AAIP42_000011 [Flavobacterium psychrophilum]|nr:hypothetical protein [Flavobacterium psychrophilum]
MSAENQFNLETIEVSTLPELQGWKEKQETIVLDNPFIEIIDNKTYEEAKKARTTLVSARTTIEKQDKLIASKLKDVRTKAGKFSLELVNITLPHEEKQQEEVKRYEAVKEAERVAKEKAERERKDAFEKKIESIYQTAKSKIDNLNFTSIEVLKNDFENNLYKTDVSEFEEFELQFASKVQILKQQLEDKIKVVTAKENQRIEAEKLAKAKADFEAEKLAKAKADKAIEEKRIADQKLIDDANKKRQEELDGKQKAIEEKEAIIEEKTEVLIEKEKAIEEKEAIIEEKTEVLIEKEKAIEEKTVAKSEPTPTPVPAPVPAPVPTSTPTTPIEDKESKAIRIIIDAIANLNIEEINEAIKNNEITIDEMVAEFKKQLITLIK